MQIIFSSVRYCTEDLPFYLSVFSNLVLRAGYWLLIEQRREKSKRKEMNRNWSNQKANPVLKTKAGNK